MNASPWNCFLNESGVRQLIRLESHLCGASLCAGQEPKVVKAKSWAYLVVGQALGCRNTVTI